MKNSKRGSALISAVIVIIIGGVIIGSYLNLTLSERKAVERSVLYDLAMDVAESAAEDAVHTLNEGDDKYWSAWSDHTIKGQAAKIKRVSGIDIGSGREGSYKAVILGAGTSDPELIIEGTVTSPMIGDVKRQLAIKLNTRGIFGNGLTTPNAGDDNAKITFSDDDILITGYDSAAGEYNRALNASDEVLVAAETKADHALDIKKAEIFGSVATSGGELAHDGAIVRGEDSSNSFGLDSSRIYDDYFATSPAINAPSLTGAETNLPSVENGQIIIGDSSEKYELSNLKVGESEELVISGSTVIVVSEDAEIEGDIVFESAGSLRLYVKNDLTISGNVYMDEATAEDFIIFGTADVPSDPEGDISEIHLNHLGALKAGVLAPNSLVIFEKGTISDSKKGNNGWGNGDQDAPGGSGDNNNAENSDKVHHIHGAGNPS